MSFESGSLSCRFFYLPQPLPSDAVRRFAAKAAPGLDTLGDTPIHGWVSGRHLLDRRIDETTAHYAGHLRLTLMTAERKIPESLLRAECRIEELAQMEARGLGELDRKTRSAIRKEVAERLLPQMPPQLKGMTLVHAPDADVCAAEAVSDKQLEAFDIGVRQALGYTFVAVTPETAPARRQHLDVRDLGPTSFSPECEDDAAGGTIGQDYLTWLWFLSEARGGIVKLPDLGEFGLMLEGPLTFYLEGAGAFETVVRRGFPLVSAEAKTALLSGKKLRRATLIMARGNETWRASVEADTFVFRGIKLPEGEKLDPVSRFTERMTLLNTFRNAFLALYDRFIAERTDPKAWAKTRNDIHQWVAERTARR